MADKQLVRVSVTLVDTPIRRWIFMAGMVPPIAMARVDLLILELNTSAPIKHVTQSRCALDPDLLDLLPPARFKNLIRIHANADVHVLWDQRNIGVARMVKPPRRDANLMDDHALFLANLDRSIRASRVRHKKKIRLSRRIRPAFDEFFLILRNCVNTDLGRDLLIRPAINANFTVNCAPSRFSEDFVKTLLRPVIHNMGLMWITLKLRLWIMSNRNADDDRIRDLAQLRNELFGLILGHMLEHIAGKRNVETLKRIVVNGARVLDNKLFVDVL